MAKEPQRLGVGEAREQFRSLVDAAADGARFVVTRHGKDRCAIVSMEDLQRLVQRFRNSPSWRAERLRRISGAGETGEVEAAPPFPRGALGAVRGSVTQA
ncbi:MAG: type II toxin-antitoxin system Phd/YefM family antitoxin, partial [Planctomycetota bacterium]